MSLTAVFSELWFPINFCGTFSSSSYFSLLAWSSVQQATWFVPTDYVYRKMKCSWSRCLKLGLVTRGNYNMTAHGQIHKNQRKKRKCAVCIILWEINCEPCIMLKFNVCSKWTKQRELSNVNQFTVPVPAEQPGMYSRFCSVTLYILYIKTSCST